MLEDSRLAFRGGAAVLACGISDEAEPSADRLRFSRYWGAGLQASKMPVVRSRSESVCDHTRREQERKVNGKGRTLGGTSV